LWSAVGAPHTSAMSIGNWIILLAALFGPSLATIVWLWRGLARDGSIPPSMGERMRERGY
jgi:hypothetical protein